MLFLDLKLGKFRPENSNCKGIFKNVNSGHNVYIPQWYSKYLRDLNDYKCCTILSLE